MKEGIEKAITNLENETNMDDVLQYMNEWIKWMNKIEEPSKVEHPIHDMKTQGDEFGLSAADKSAIKPLICRGSNERSLSCNTT